MYYIVKIDENSIPDLGVNAQNGLVVKNIDDIAFFWKAALYERFLDEQHKIPTKFELCEDVCLDAWIRSARKEKLSFKMKEKLLLIDKKIDVLVRKRYANSPRDFRNRNDVIQLISFLQKNMCGRYIQSGKERYTTEYLFNLFDLIESVTNREELLILCLRGTKNYTYNAIGATMGKSPTYCREIFNRTLRTRLKLGLVFSGLSEQQ